MYGLCENKGPDQLRGNHAADQGLCFSYIDCTTPLLSKSKYQDSSYLLWLDSPVCVRPGLNPDNRFSRNMAHISICTIHPIRILFHPLL